MGFFIKIGLIFATFTMVFATAPLAARGSFCEKVLNSLPQDSDPVPTAKIKVRKIGGGLEESMATVVEIEPTKSALASLVTRSLGHTVDAKAIHVRFYGVDNRIGWNTYIVIVDNWGPFGYANGPIEQ